jgi:hypothetical protein
MPIKHQGGRLLVFGAYHPVDAKLLSPNHTSLIVSRLAPLLKFAEWGPFGSAPMAELAAKLARRRLVNAAKGEVVSSGQGAGGPIATLSR